MISLVRPSRPAPLTRRSVAETQKLWNAWRRNEDLEVNSSLYNHQDVKNALRKAQSDKCAYCETRNPTSHDVIEHFRPWNGWRQARQDVLAKPQYFWLAYDWDNLLFACDVCHDQGHKGNLFPLANPVSRATAAQPNIAAEDPLLINPYNPYLNPEDHITWDRDVPKTCQGSAYGLTTIETLGLDRGDRRADYRRDYLQRLEKELIRGEALTPNNPDRLTVKADLMEFLDACMPWTAMVRANFGARIQAL